jgi:hypothetical protein
MAGAGKKTFTAGEVLTASDVNTYLMEQSVMVFGGTAARSSAIPTPSEGMVSYRSDIDNLQLYNGSEWTAASGMQLIKKQTIGSGVSSVNVTSAFSATYTNYLVIISGGASSVTNTLYLRLGNPGNAHYGALITAGFGASSVSSVGCNNLATWNNNGIGLTSGLQMQTVIRSPFLTTNSSCQSIIFDANANTGTFTGMLNDNTSYTDFTISTSTGTLTGGTIYVYGYGT